MIEDIKMEKEKAKNEKRVKSHYYSYLMEFLNSDNNTMRMRFTSDYEARKCSNSIRSTSNKKNLNVVVWQKGVEVVVIKA